MMVRRTISRATFTSSSGKQVPVSVTLSYDDQDPFAVTMDISPAEHRTIRWAFERDLLKRGRHTKSGIGDVTVEPEVYQVHVHLSSPDGHGTITMPTLDVREFLDVTYDAVPDGWEAYDLDMVVDNLLASPSGDY